MRGLCERLWRARERRAEAAAALDRARASLADGSRTRAEHEQALEAWSTRWAEAVACLGLDRDAAPEEADDVQAALAELGTELDVADGLRHRVRGMEQACEALEHEVAALIARHLPTLASAGDLEHQATALIQQSRQNREAARRRADLEARRARCTARERELGAARQILEQGLERLLGEAGVAQRSELPAAEAASKARRRAEADLAEIDAALRELCGTADLADVRARAAGVSLLDARSRGLEALAELGAEAVHLDVPDCIYRLNPATSWPLYAGDQAIFGSLHPAELTLVRRVATRLTTLLRGFGRHHLYVPLTVGNHVDHQLTRRAAEVAGGIHAYYEDYPYVAQAGERWPNPGQTMAHDRPLTPEFVRLNEADLTAKVAAVGRYASQLSPFWADAEAMDRALRRFATQTGGEAPAERLWRPGG